jgi:hypothetical protein
MGADLSGRNTARAAVGREFPTCTLSVVRRVPSSAIAHVSVSPPLIPDSRLSRVRLAAAACLRRTFPNTPRVKRLLVYAPWMMGYTSSSTSSEVVTVSLALCPGGVSFVTPAAYREPLCLGRVLPASRVTSTGHLRERYPSFVAPTGSCAGPRPSHLPRSPSVSGSLQVVASPC